MYCALDSTFYFSLLRKKITDKKILKAIATCTYDGTAKRRLDLDGLNRFVPVHAIENIMIELRTSVDHTNTLNLFSQ